MIHRVVDNESNPRWSKHVIDEVCLVEAPVVGDFADLETLEVVVAVDERVHVAVQALQVVDCCRVELHFNEILRVGANDEVDIVPVRKK